MIRKLIALMAGALTAALCYADYSSDFEHDGLYYKIYSSEADKHAAVVKPYEGFEYEIEHLVIPDSVPTPEGEMIAVKRVDATFSKSCCLKSVKLGSNITILHTSFDECPNLVSVDYSSIKFDVLHVKVFYMCTSLTDFKFPQGIRRISDMVFTGCPLGDGDFKLPETVESIGWAAFSFTNIKSIDLSHVKRLGIAALSAGSLSNVVWGDSLTYIDIAAFINQSIESVFISKNITFIGDRAFMDCHNLKEVICLAPDPDAILNVHDDYFPFPVENEGLILWVPTELVERYRTAKYWCDFKDIRPIPNGNVDEVAASTDDHVEVYSLSGTKVMSGSPDALPSLPSGIYIVKSASQVRKIAI